MHAQDDDRDPFEGRVDGLYLVLISLHGLVRGERMELGKDPDTGGQARRLAALSLSLTPSTAWQRRARGGDVQAWKARSCSWDTCRGT
jgi:hypothetical protein